jgi:hypothetical protein
MRNTLFMAGLFAGSLAITACNNAPRTEEPAATVSEADREAERLAELRREREEEITRMDERVSTIEKDYLEKTQAQPRGTAGRATAGLREEVREDMTNVKQAISDLRTTTAENWWERHERAMKETADDVEADVKRFVRTLPAAEASKEMKDAAEASAAPFESRRDRFAADIEARIDSWKAGLDKVRVRGARETELKDLQARIDKLDADVDRLKKASADDWWDLTKERVSEYIDRVEESVARLDS